MRNCGDVGQCHQCFHNRHLGRVHRGVPRRGRKAHDDVVEYVKLVEADLLNGLRQSDDSVATFAVAYAWELNG